MPGRHFALECGGRAVLAGCPHIRLTPWKFGWRILALLTEQEVSRSWSTIFRSKDFSDKTFEHAETLLDELRLESPLRHRLTQELGELRSIHSKVAPTKS